MKLTAKLWLGLAALVLLCPLGLLLPEHFKAGGAWGEWGADEIGKLTGYVPQGLEKLASLWQAPMPEYGFKGGQGKGLFSSGFAYIMSAVAGVAVIVSAVFFIGRMLTKRDAGKKR